jgi:hypothetical protein
VERLWISNIAADTSDADLVALVKTYAPDLECFKVQRVEGGGSRQGALLWFRHRSLDPATGAAPPGEAEAVAALLESLKKLSRRLNGLYWKGQTLSSSTVVLEPPY